MPSYPKKPEMNFTPVPEGTHIARLYSIVHLGTTGYEYMGEYKESYKIRLSFELPTKTKVFDEKKGEQPFTISADYGFTTGKKSKLRPVVESLVGKSLTDEEAFATDIETLLGKPCLIRVVHDIKNDKTYSNIESTLPLMEGQVCPPQVNPNFVLSFDEWDIEKFNKLPEFLRNKISATGEYRAKSPEFKENMKKLHESQKAKVENPNYNPDELDPSQIPF